MKEFNLENLKDSEKIVDFAQMKQIDNLKTKVLKYALYKKRTENEIREKFSEEDENLLEDVIENLKELNYINDKDYIERSIQEFIALKSLSIKEVSYKLLQKGIKKSLETIMALNLSIIYLILFKVYIFLEISLMSSHGELSV